MKLKCARNKISFIFVMLMLSLTLFCIDNYTLVNAEETNSSKLSSLKIEGYNLSPEFNSEIYEYEVSVYIGEIDLNIITTTIDDDAVVSIDGNKYIKEEEGEIIITVSEPNTANTIYKINYIKKLSANVGYEYMYSYTGSYQTFTVPISGVYQIELWGAQGGFSSAGKGAYTKGNIKLKKGVNLYVYVGQGLNETLNGTSFNGGTANAGGRPGGGATDIRLSQGTTWKDFESLKSRIMVAAGSGSGSGNSTIDLGYGGTLQGGAGGGTLGGTQTSAGGYQSSNYAISGFGYANGGCAGGNGYYGGGASTCANGAGGGSSYISGYEGVDSISEESTVNNIIHTGSSVHYSGYTFEEAVMIAGNDEMPTYDGTSTMVGNSGNGYAKITRISSSKDNYLTEITSDYGILSPSFEPTITEYTLTLDKYDSYFTLDGNLSDESAESTGFGYYEIDTNETKEIIITVTSESGDIKIYKINAIRETLKDGENSSKLKKLETSNYYQNIEPKFHPLTTEYNIKLTYTKINLDIITEAFDEDAKIDIQGNEYIKNNSGVITITVSEPNVEDTVYTINYIKEYPLTDLADSYNYSYIGDYEIFTAPITGIYQIELWGAQGGFSSAGKGAYTKGNIKLNQETNLYIYVGEGLNQITNGTSFNGGTGNIDGTPGGGATDIRLLPGETWRDFDSLKTRIMVAAGSGSGSGNKTINLGYGGTLEGGSGGGTLGGTQISAGSRQANIYLNSGFGYADGGCSGGGGYYGGGASTCANGAGGGSSYISGYEGVDSISEESTETNIIHTGSATHYSGYTFEEAVMIAGNEDMPTYDGTSTMVGNSGNGYAKITPLMKSEDNYLSELTSDYGTLSPNFNPTIENYTLTLDKYDQYFNLTGILSDENSEISGLGYYDIELGETKKINVIITSESGDIRTYTVTAIRENFTEGEHTSKLKSLETNAYQLEMKPEFHPLTTEYNLTISDKEVTIDVIAETFDKEATIAIEGNKFIQNDTGVITITVTEPNVEDTIYTITYTKSEVFAEYEYSYTNDIQEFIVPFDGNYILEVWGAQGGGYNSLGGKGGYSKGVYHGNKNEKLYVYVGGQGTTETGYNKELPGGWNGGGGGATDSSGGYSTYVSGSGGGATDISTEYGEVVYENYRYIRTEESYKSRIIVAGGGAGAWAPVGAYSTSYFSRGGVGGGLSGGSGYLKGSKSTVVSGGTQTEGGMFSATQTDSIGKFGYGGNEDTVSSNKCGVSGGGGGYYGGGGGNTCDAEYSGSGGSGYIGGVSSLSLSSLEIEAQTIAGNLEVPTYDGTETMVGNSGDGYAKITPIMLSRDNYLLTIVTDKGTLSPEFDPTVEEYTINLGVDDTKIKLSARPSSDLAVIEGLGEFEVRGGTTTFEIKVTAESGDVRTYKVNVTRPSSSESKAKNIQITGLVPSICDGREGYCELDKEFNEEETIYYMTVPAGIRKLEFTVDKGHDYQEVVGEGVVTLKGGDNIVTIEITSEDGENKTVYNYEIYRDMTGNNYIDKLEITNPSVDIGFNYLITEYAFKVENEVTSLEMNIELDDENASYRVIGNENFVVGNNIVEIEVTAANGEIRNYILNVYRVSNSNPLLSSLEVTNGDISYTLSPEFEDIKTNYTLSVGNEVENVTINATAQAETTEISGTGIYELKTGLNQIKVITTAEDGTIETYTIIITRAKNSNNYLSTLTANEGAFNETFDKTVENYTMTVNPYVKSLNLTYTKEASTSSVSVSGNSNFKIGENKITIRVTAEDRSVRNYYITVTKEGSEINYLSSLTDNQGMLKEMFDKETLMYSIEVENSVTSITINGEKEDSLSTVKGFGTYRLTSGENNIKVTVTSETGKERIYWIKVIRKYNTDASLREITVSRGNLVPEFDRETKEYKVNVENEVEEITVKGYATESTTEVEGNGTYKLEVGENEIKINTVAEDGETTDAYVIKVVRDISSNANLSYLIVKEGVIKPTFNPMTLNYTVKVLNETENVTVEAEAEKETSSVSITGGSNLEVGENKVNVIVTAEDGSVKTYEITVIRLDESASNLNLKTLDVTSCTLNPEFSGSIGYYECEVSYEVEEVIVSASLEDETNTLSGTGTYTLNVGRNVLGVTVTNELEIEKGYQIVVTRKESTESRLKNISIEGHTLNEIFDKDTYSYSVSTEETSLDIEVEKMHEGQIVEISGNENFVLGENVVEIKVTSPDLSNTSTYTLKVTKEKSSNNYLMDLEVEGYEISPAFTKGQERYSLTVENEEMSVIVKGSTEDVNASVSGLGMYTLNKGENEIKVTVVAENGEERIYTINVTRLGTRNNNLTSLEVADHKISPEFEKDTLKYTLEVEYEVSEIYVNANAEDENATITGDGIRSLEVGENKINVTVTAEAGDVKTYEIIVTRKEPVTGYLKNIEVKNYYLDREFVSKELEYTVVVDNEVSNIVLEIEKLDPNSTYEIVGADNLEVGLNEVQVISTSSDKAEVITYTLTVNRQTYSNTYLSALSVSEGELSPAFEKTLISYEVEVGNEVESIEVEASAENITSEVIGTGKYNLKVGENKIKVTVTSAGGIVRTYTVNVIRKSSNNANIESIRSTIGSISKESETSYKLVVPKGTEKITSENIIVTTEDASASVEKMEELNLNEGREYVITVTSPDLSIEKEYVIYIEYEKSSDARIKELKASIGDLEPEFEKDTYEYTLNVLDTESEVEFEVELNDELSTLLTENLVYELKEYTTEVEISVQAEDGSISIYKIKVEKSITTEKYLEDINITGVREICETCILPEYSETTYDYKLLVPYEVSEIGYEIIKKHQNQEVKIYKEEVEVQEYILDVGINNYRIEVKNGIGEVTNYRYEIERLKSTNNYLISLKVLSPEIEIEDFDKEKLEYSVQIPNEYENISIEAIAEDEENASIQVRGTTYLLEGNNDVSIKVRSAAGEIREYILHVLRTPESNNLLQTLTVSSGDIYDLSPRFMPGITSYTLTVPSIISKITVEGIADDENAVVEGNGEYDLVVGQNEIIIKVTSVEGIEKEYKIKIIRESSKNVYLKRLEVTNGSMTEGFEKEKALYTVNVGNEVEALEMIIETEDEKATYEVKGNSNLLYGENKVKIKVISSDKSAAKTYVLTVIKEGESNNNLISITTDGEEIEGFETETTEYNITVENKQDSINVGAISESKYANISGLGIYALEEGNNEIIITVTAQNGEIKTYKLNVYRKHNDYLSEIVTDRGEVSPTFEREIVEYTLEVENEIEDITIIGLKEDSNATVEGNGTYELKVGENKINLVVKNVEERTYTVNVIRKGSDNTYLSYLTVGESILNPEFDKETEEYTVYIPDDKTEISLDYKTEDETSIVEVIGNENFSESEEKVIIRVTSTSGAVRDYTINVIREDASLFNNKLKNLTVSEGTMSPQFDPDTNEYAVTVGGSIEEIQVNAEVYSLEVKVEGVGTHKLERGRNVIQVKATSKDGKVRVYTIIVYRRDSSDARLSTLEINEGTLNPVFNKNVYNYVLIVESDTKIITEKKIVPVEKNATYEIKGDVTKITTGNEIKVEVTAPDGETKKEYTLVLRVEKSSNAKLKSLTSNVGELSPEFDKEENSYKLVVGSDIQSISIGAVPESTKAFVRGIGVHKLTSGTTYINITVTAENGNTNVYSIEVTKEKSNNNYLKDLIVKGYEISPSFEKTTEEYEVEVENEEESVIINAEAESELSEVIGTGEVSLKVGENKVSVVVQAENGEIRTYTVTIIRKKKVSSKIKSLSVKEGELSPTFSSEVYEYNVVIPNEYTKITEVIELEEEEATYEIIGNENLEVGENEVEIKVRSSEGEESVYKIKVIKQVASNNYLKSLKVDKGSLSPEFTREEQNYEVKVGTEVEEIKVEAEAEVSTTEVEGIGTYKLTEEETEIIIEATSEIGVIRTYKVKVIREKSTNNYLSTIVTSEGELNPAFEKEEQNYEVVVGEGTEEIEINAVAEENTTIVTGIGKYEIKVGENKITLEAISESGEVRIYTVKVIRNISSNTNIIRMTPSEGELKPAFDNSVSEYEIEVGKEVTVVEIEVELESKVASVTGHENIIINGRETEAKIIVTAEDGTERIVTVIIKRESMVEGIEVEKEIITIGEKEEYQIEAKVMPEEVTNKGLLYETTEEEIVSVDETGKIIGNKVGTASIIIRSEENEEIEKMIMVNVVLKEIRTSIYSVEEKEEGKIIIGAEEKETIQEFIEKLDNPENTIRIYEKERKIEDYTGIIKTGMKIQIEIDGEIYDEGIIVIRGDINEDGIINVTDKVALQDHILQTEIIEDYRKYACELEKDEVINVSDNVKLGDYILKKITTLN